MIGRLLVGLLVFWTCHAWPADDRVSLVFTDVRAVDLARVAYGEIAGQPFVLSPEILDAPQLHSVQLRSVERFKAVAMVRELLRSSGFEVRDRNGIVWIGKAKEAEDEVIVYRPVHRSARYLADVVQSVTGARSLLARSIRQVEAGAAHPVQGVGQVQQAQQGRELRQVSPSSVEGQIDRSEVDQIAFSVSLKDVAKVRKLLADLDTSTGEVVLKAAVYEVGFDRREGSAIKIVASILDGRLGVTLGSSLDGAARDGVVVGLKAGGLEVVLSALDADGRFKSVSRPQVRVRNGGQARFTVGQDVPVLGAAQMDKNGNPVQSVDYRSSGVILDVRPEIREGVIELSLRQELSKFVTTSTGVNGSPTLIKRAVDTRLGIQPGEVVVFAGLQDDQLDESASRLPFLGWLLGQQRQQRQNEILVFIEAIRI